MDISLDLSDLYYTAVAKDDDSIFWNDSEAVNLRFEMTQAERLAFFGEWLNAEEDHTKGRFFAILKHFADEQGWELSERDPGPDLPVEYWGQAAGFDVNKMGRIS
jgi:hypothetical protein